MTRLRHVGDDVKVIMPGLTVTKTLNPAYIKEAQAALVKEMEISTRRDERSRAVLNCALPCDAVMLPNKNIFVWSPLFYYLLLYR